MKIGYLGAGTWGTALANLLTKNGHKVKVWDRDTALLKLLDKKREHPKLPGCALPKSIEYGDTLEEAIKDVDLIVESVTSSGIRPVLEQVYQIRKKDLCPIVITSKGIEQHTGLLFPEIAIEILKEENKNKIGCLSGPSHAEEVIKDMPTSVVCSSFDRELMYFIGKAFNSSTFRRSF